MPRLGQTTARRQRERELEAIVTVTTALRTAVARADMLPVVLDQLFGLLEVQGAALALRDPLTGETVVELGRGDWDGWIGQRLPPGQGVSGLVIATGEPYVSDDLRQDALFVKPDLIGELGAVACVPLIAQQQTIGAIWIGRTAPFDQMEVRLLTAVSDIAANAIYRATLHEQTTRRLQRLAALRAIDVAITSSMDVRLTLNVLLDQVLRQLQVDAAAVMLHNADLDRLDYAASLGIDLSSLQHIYLATGSPTHQTAIRERTTIHIPAVQQVGQEFYDLLSHEHGVASSFVVPLVSKGQVLGVLDVFHRAPLQPDHEWHDFLETLAGQAAIAIDNATLFASLQRSHAELSEAYDATLAGWSYALDLRDKETEGHAERVTTATVRLARRMGIPEAEVVHIRRGALLHDIGKMGIPDRILLKPGPLDDDEWAVMRKHPVYARDLLAPISFLRPSLEIPFCHHEKWDGTGYPRGLKGEEIPLSARIFAVVDVWDALRSDRPYHRRWPNDEVLNYIRHQSGKHFDPTVVNAFLAMLEEHSTTKLSTIPPLKAL